MVQEIPPVNEFVDVSENNYRNVTVSPNRTSSFTFKIPFNQTSRILYNIHFGSSGSYKIIGLLNGNVFFTIFGNKLCPQTYYPFHINLKSEDAFRIEVTNTDYLAHDTYISFTAKDEKAAGNNV